MQCKHIQYEFSLLCHEPPYSKMGLNFHTNPFSWLVTGREVYLGQNIFKMMLEIDN
jgi:hypothetical protein